MKKLRFVFLLGASALLFGCVKENNPAPEARSVTISATLSDATKVAFAADVDGSGNPILSLTWAENDKIRVYNHADHAQYSDFTLNAESIGQKTGYFSGTAISASSYDIEVLNGELDLSEQTQPSDGATGDIKYLASAQNVSNYTTIIFTDISGVLLLRTKLPSSAVAGQIKSVDIVASEPLFHDNGSNDGKTLKVTLAATGDDASDGILLIYAALPVGDRAIPDGTTLLVHYNAPGTAHTVYTRYIVLSPLTFAQGKLNQIDINAKDAAQWAGWGDSGSVTTPYLIADKYQLDAIRDLLVSGQKKYFRLVDDIDLDNATWTPIDASSAYVNLDGNGKTIKNFTMTGTTSPTGLFSTLNGQVENLTIDNGSLTTTSAATGAGGILAGNLGNGGTETACVSEVRISNCTVGSGNSHMVAGILAGNIYKEGTIVKNVTITDSQVSCGTDSQYHSYAGGLVGYVRSASTIVGCRVSGCSVSGADIVGGLFGSLGLSSAPNCTYCFVENTTVTGRYRRVGGLVGWHQGGTIARCGVEADVTVSSNTYDVGGITGIQDAAATVENSYSHAGISGSDNVGGLVGRLSGSVDKCYASGTPTTTGAKGGLVGLINSGATVGKSISWNTAVALAGTNNGTVTDCYTRSGTDTSVSAHAQESARSWSGDIWDFSTDFPALKDSDLPNPEPEEVDTRFLIIPYPSSLTPGTGSFNVSTGGGAVYFDSAFGAEGADVANQMATRLGVSLQSTSGAGAGTGFNLLKDTTLGDEAYSLSVTSGKVVVKAKTRTGLFYAWQTLKQLLPADVYGSSAVSAQWTIPCVEIADASRFAHRGFALDVSRHFFSVDEVKKYLDLMALYKMNVFHWGLTNDHGWRVQIDAYPELTHTGGYRESSPVYPGADRNNGFYTKAQVAEIIQYAAERCITVIPEINMPGHFMAALASYPALGCTGSGYHVWTVLPATLPDVLCLGKYFNQPYNNTLLKAVLDEVMDMFPSEYIHIGGDEVLQRENNMVKWHTCDVCTAKMTELGLVKVDSYTPETRFQYMFAKDIRQYLASHGRKAICWQESINDWYDLENDGFDFSGGAIESWTSGSAGLKAARNGIDAVMSPSFACYFDIAQTGTAGEPGSGPVNGGGPSNGGIPVTLNKAYDWNPVWNLTAAEQVHVKGVECAMWTEFITTTTQLEYMLLPRLAATSEVGWTPKTTKDYERFTSSLTGKHFGLYSQLGYNFRSTQDF